MIKDILIVDDNPSFREQLKEILHELGYDNITTAMNGREALSVFQDHQVILTDWNMPEMTGVELIREIRKSSPSPKPYVIMLTSENETRGIIKALEEGIDSYIMKPFNINDLKRKMKQVEDLF